MLRHGRHEPARRVFKAATCTSVRIRRADRPTMSRGRPRRPRAATRHALTGPGASGDRHPRCCIEATARARRRLVMAAFHKTPRVCKPGSGPLLRSCGWGRQKGPRNSGASTQVGAGCAILRWTARRAVRSRPRETDFKRRRRPSARFFRFRSADASLRLRVCSAFWAGESPVRVTFSRSRCSRLSRRRSFAACLSAKTSSLPQ